MRRTDFPEKWMDWNGIKIRYIDEGHGDPILFLHGLGGKIEDNDTCFEYLVDRHRVVAMDCPGSGWSDKPDQDYSIDYLVDFSLDFATRMGLEKFFLCGGSQGGMQTLLCCHKAPERIPRAAVYSPSGVWAPRPLVAKLFRTLPPEAVRTFFQVSSLMWNSPTYPGYWENRKKSLEHINTRELPGFGHHVFGCLASVMDRDYRKLYAQIQTPTLIVWGRHDFGMPVTQGRELNKLMPDSRLIEVPKAGHNVSTEKPEYFAETVMEFFGKL